MDRARKGLGPTLIEAETYRYRGHSLADPDELRKKEEKAHWAVRLQSHLFALCLASAGAAAAPVLWSAPLSKAPTSWWTSLPIAGGLLPAFKGSH